MAFTAPNYDSRKPRDSRVIHRQATINPIGGAGTSVATANLIIPGAGRLIAAAVTYTTQAATTDLLVKAESSAGVTILNLTNVNTSITARPVGTTGVSDTSIAIDGLMGRVGGFPVRAGVWIDVAQADDSSTGAKPIVVDLWFKIDRYIKVQLVAQSGADGTGAVTRLVDAQGAGALAALAVQYLNMPVTTDLLIKADSTTGLTLFSRPNSVTDLAPTLLARAGMGATGAANAALAADAIGNGNVFKRGLFLDLAQADIFTTGNETVTVEMWIEQ